MQVGLLNPGKLPVVSVEQVRRLLRIAEDHENQISGESPRGISPRGARRTVREPLDSYSSHHGATPHPHLPVGKQLRITSRNARDPPRRPTEMMAQLLVFPLGPEGKISV